MGWAHEVLGPLFAQLGWVPTRVKGKEGWRYRVAGGSYLLYLEDCLPQTWHLDSPDPLSISVLLPITENCVMTDFAADAHQPRETMMRIMEKAGWDTWLRSEEDLDERLERLPPGLAEEVLADLRTHFVYDSKFRGQGYKVAPISNRLVRPGAVVFWHSFICHRAKAHFLDMDPRSVFFFQMQYTQDDFGEYSASEQIYLGPSTVWHTECDYEYLSECYASIATMGQCRSLLDNLPWHHREKKLLRSSSWLKPQQRWLLLFYWYVILRKSPNNLDFFLPNWKDIPTTWHYNFGDEGLVEVVVLCVYVHLILPLILVYFMNILNLCLYLILCLLAGGALSRVMNPPILTRLLL